MRRLLLVVCGLAAFVCAGQGAARSAATLCVGSQPGCYATIQAAVNAAQDGDIITIAPGVYAGGITLNVSVRIVGAGAPATVIEGGGPVMLIGAPFPWSPKRPTISISGVMIMGGVNNLFPDPEVAGGGGIAITPSAPPMPGPGATGATVTISDSVITGNRVYAQTLIPPGFCGPEVCAFALGGGIDNSGVLTLTNTQVTDNDVSSPPGVATSVSSGGIFNHPQGTLTVSHSVVSGNRVVGAELNAREAIAGGISSDGPLRIGHSSVSDNTVTISSAVPTHTERAAFAGGIFVDDCCGLAGTARITSTIIRGNRVSARNLGGDATAFGGALVETTPSSLSISDSTIDHNAVSAENSSGNAFADGGGLEIDGVATIGQTHVTFNSVTTTADAGTAIAEGGGVANAGHLTLQRTLVRNNTATARGASGAAQGGGVWDGTFGDSEAPEPTLTVLDSVIVHNRLSGSSAIALQGGGLYAGFPVRLARTVLAGNIPDQCYGC